jgi:hypothetical protein
MYWWEDCFYTFFSHPMQEGRTLTFPSVETLAGEVLEKVDELGDRLFVVISGDARKEVTVRIAALGKYFPPVAC